MSNLEALAFFYPLSRQDKERRDRAEKLGRELVDETMLTQTAEPLFAGHRQPRIHCLGDPKITSWNDASEPDIARQAEYAKDHYVGGWIFTMYSGLIGGRPVREMTAPLDAFCNTQPGQAMKFAVMPVLARPRVIIPIPRQNDYEEPDRYYDYTPETARQIVDDCAQNYWTQSNYLTREGQPYLFIFSPYRKSKEERTRKAKQLIPFINELREYSQKKYRTAPYIVGVIVGYLSLMESVDAYVQTGVNALTCYAFLPQFGQDAPFQQDYSDLVRKRMIQWEEISQRSHLPFLPPAVVGWDATPRGERGYKNNMKAVIGYEPWHPVVINNTPPAFGHMLRKTIDFQLKHSPDEQPLPIIASQTEIIQGHGLTPELRDGEVDFSYLQVVKDVIYEYRSSSPR